MKKIIGLLLMSFIILNAGTVGGESKDPRNFGKLFFDYTINGEKFFEYILAGGRKNMYIDPRVLNHLKAAKEIDFVIKGRIDVPEHITSASIVVKTPVYKSPLNSSYSSDNLFISNKQIQAFINSTKILSDSLGNRYVEIMIKGKVRHYLKDVVTHLPNYTVKIASSVKKRGQDFAWEDAKFYVIE